MSVSITLGNSCMEITAVPTVSNTRELIVKKHITGVFPIKFQQRQVGDTDWTYPYNTITKIRLYIKDGRKIDIELQSVINQPTWNNGTLTALKTAAEDINQWLQGTVLPAPPYIVPVKASTVISIISTPQYNQGSGPSGSSMTFKIQAMGLSPAAGNIVVTPSTNFEVYTGAIWTSAPFNVAYTGGAITTAEIYMVRLKAGLTANNYSEIITFSGGGAPVYNLTATGTVVSVNDFIITVKTDNAGVSANNQFKIPLSTGAMYSCVIDWGDATTTNQTNDVSPTHTYPAPGTYQIRVTGIFQAIEFNNDGDRLKLLDINNWGNNTWTLMRFWGCANLTGTYSDIPNTAACITFYALFANCFVFNGTVAGWNTANGASFVSCFQNCTLFNKPLTGWDTGNSLDFTSMFLVAAAFNQPLNFLNTGKVTNMTSMFNLATAFNQNISSWDVSKLLSAANFMSGKAPGNYSAANLDAIYNSWSLQVLKPNVSIGFGTIKYTAGGAAGKAILTGAPNNWIIVDGGI